MKVKCMLCEKEEYLDPNSLLAKKFQNHPLKTFLCVECNTRIEINTLNRKKKVVLQEMEE